VPVPEIGQTVPVSTGTGALPSPSSAFTILLAMFGHRR
jgi:hypothetical protein